MNPLTNYHKDISTLYFLLMYSIISRRKLHDVIFKSQIRKRQSFEKPCNESNNLKQQTEQNFFPWLILITPLNSENLYCFILLYLNVIFHII